jgi:hypothetical protein
MQSTMKNATHETILAKISELNQAAKKSTNIERAVIRVDPTDGSPVLVFPDDAANLGKYNACFIDGMPHSGEISYDWYVTTKPLSKVKNSEQFLADLDRLIEYNARSFDDQTAVPTMRIYLKIFRK